MNFEQAWEEYILPKYGINTYANDYNLSDSDDGPFCALLEKALRITDRTDLTHISCYTIDPDGCEDADDGFSFHNGILYIHIADPTHYFSPTSDCFDHILKNGLTHYPSGASVRHMMPPAIVHAASLMGADTIKNAITIAVNIDPISFLPVGQAQVLFTTVRCTTATRFTYQTAAHHREVFGYPLAIAKQMRIRRNGVGDKLAELSNEDSATLETRQMIAEFAIFANTTIAQYLQLNKGVGVFRICKGYSPTDDTPLNSLTASELMQHIINNGLAAEYLTSQGAHDLVGVPNYCHFTSPLRRATDCICHYLVKAAYSNSAMPFTESELESMTKHLDKISKKERKIQYDDKKFRRIQELYRCTPFCMSFRVTGYTGLFLNVMITHANDDPINISYVLRMGPDYKGWDLFWKNIDSYTILINTVNVPSKYDKGIFPELDAILEEPPIIMPIAEYGISKA